MVQKFLVAIIGEDRPFLLKVVLLHPMGRREVIYQVKVNFVQILVLISQVFTLFDEGSANYSGQLILFAFPELLLEHVPQKYHIVVRAYRILG